MCLSISFSVSKKIYNEPFHGRLISKDEIHHDTTISHQNIMAKGSLLDSFCMINKHQEILSWPIEVKAKICMD